MIRFLLPLALAASAAVAMPPARFIAPQQPWASADGQVRLLRPVTAQPTTAEAPLGALMTPGWRLVWDAKTDGRGTIAIRLALPVVPAAGTGQRTEVLQAGWSAAPSARRTCLSFGLAGPSARRLPDRTINGTRFTAWTNNDAGMSQHIAATDLRALVRGRCYAVERFSYDVSAADRDPAVTLPQAQGAAMLDTALASLHLGPGAPLAPPHMAVPKGTVAR